MIPDYRIEHLRKTLGHLYEFDSFLGRGAFATVLLVRNKKLERFEALKVLQESYDGDHEFAKRFVEEAKLVASLDHPNIVKVYDYGEAEGVLWYSMQFVRGSTLRAEVDVRPRFSHREVVSVAVPLLDALANSHAAGIVHRDVKPGNIMISRRGRPYLMDFGIAKVKDSVLKTQTGSILGTPAYISPEQASGEGVDGRSDVYSLGTCLYQLVSGCLPFVESDPVRMLVRRLHEDPLPLSAVAPQVHPELESIIMRALARQVWERFQSATEMRDQLLAAFRQDVDDAAVRLTAETVVPVPFSPIVEPLVDVSELATVIKSSPKKSDSSSTMRLAMAVLMVALVVVTVLWGISSRRQTSEMQGGSQPGDPQALAKKSPLEGSPTVVSPTEVSPTVAGPTVADLEAASAAEKAVDEPLEGDVQPEDANVVDRPQTSDLSLPAPPIRQPAAPPVIRKAVVAPSILEKASFDLDPALSEACQAKEVVLNVSINEDGQPISLRVLLSPSPACADAAKELVQRYRFKSALDYSGQPVTASMTLSIRFP